MSYKLPVEHFQFFVSRDRGLQYALKFRHLLEEKKHYHLFAYVVETEKEKNNIIFSRNFFHQQKS